ncbi:response regulator transcription factor [Inquilinus limosus]|uniref:LuxR C-terminal-related transcriptional regulator n=1 Tax=Inquilinus limosus TaxID=171674 RepID=UPI003F163EC7
MVVTEACGRAHRNPSSTEHGPDPIPQITEFHTSDHRLPLIAVVDARRLELQCLAQALSANGTGFRVRTYAGLDDWRVAVEIHPQVSALLFGIGGKPADTPELARDLQALATEFPRTPTVVIGDIETPAHVVQVLAYGMRGYIPTSVDLNIAIEAIRLAQAGGIFVPAKCLVQSLRQGRAQPATSADALSGLLTRQQAAVADALRRGKANKIIAYELNLAESTVKVHIRNIMRKVQARNRTEVAFKISNYLGQSSAPGVGSGAAIG